METRPMLNDRQMEAVRAVDGPLLILAGAGSGKTRVITERISHMISSGIPAPSILAVTFTNKAAREMLHRVKAIFPGKVPMPHISTFHSFGAHMLRETIETIGFRRNFTIYDSQDQISLIKETAREIGLKTENLDLDATAQLFSSVETGRTEWKGQEKHIRELFDEYRKNLQIYNAVDFDDLIMLPIRILSEVEEVRALYRGTFRYLLVDEFQDTSEAQYRLLKLLGEGSGNVCVVGDDDQSIYSWRGANYENILRFEKDFPGFKEIKLEQNYRSTKQILRAANGIIANNSNRKGKELWTGAPEGEPIELYMAESERKEAEFIVGKIRILRIRHSLQFHDFAVLLRANHLTRAIEEEFLKENIPYQVSGGMSFFERREVRDILSYLRIIVNPDDDVSLLRIANTPRRGIGKKVIEHLVGLAAQRECSLYSAMTILRESGQKDLDGSHPSPSPVVEFLSLMEEYRERFQVPGKASETLKALVDGIDYWGHLVQENKEQDLARIKLSNVESLMGSVEDYERNPDVVSPTLQDYLTRVSLASRDDIGDKDAQGRVSLSTIHAAKGLEFPVVFIAGVEKDLIPHGRALEEGETNVEEERRLFYVAVTRAEKKLFLSSCATRRFRGKPVTAYPSPFLEEIPPESLVVIEEETEADTEQTDDFLKEMRKRFL